MDISHINRGNHILHIVGGGRGGGSMRPYRQNSTVYIKFYYCIPLDLLTITPTGSGKTRYYIMYMLVILTVLKDPDHFPSLSFPKNPCLIVICPTIPLQLEMVSKHAISAAGLLY